MNKQSIVTFLDSTGRIIYGKLVEETPTTLHIGDPAQIFVQPTQNGQLNVQSIPIFFREFAKNTDAVVWIYNKSNIVMNQNLDLDERIVAQYNNILAQKAPTPAAPTAEPKSIKLFAD